MNREYTKRRGGAGALNRLTLELQEQGWTESRDAFGLRIWRHPGGCRVDINLVQEPVVVCLRAPEHLGGIRDIWSGAFRDLDDSSIVQQLRAVVAQSEPYRLATGTTP